MLEKTEILIVIIALLITFYFVIFLGARGSKDSIASIKIKKYLFGVRILISILALLSLILWLMF
tara:strand:+ start:487 stop:678 length:192 start_codon:yes stop_codon:yes gene_type:complete